MSPDDRLLAQIARLEVRMESLEKSFTELRPLLLERSGELNRLAVLEDDVRTLKATAEKHNRLVWGLGGALALVELLNMILPNGLRGVF